MLDVAIAAVLQHKALESLPRQEIHQLREDEFAGAHGRSRGSMNPQIRPSRDSNRGQLRTATSQHRVNGLRSASGSFSGHYWLRPRIHIFRIKYDRLIGSSCPLLEPSLADHLPRAGTTRWCPTLARSMRAKRLSMKRHIAVLLAGLLVSCGGGGSSSTGASASGSGGGGGLAGVAGRVEESDPAVTLRGTWTASDSAYGWSGGSAVQSGVAGATASITFSGTSIRWLGSRGRAMGIALVSVDGGPAKEVDLFARPIDEAHSDIVTISGLSDGPHTLTITVTGRQNTEAQGNTVVVDGFDVQPSTTVSHWQDTDP